MNCRQKSGSEVQFINAHGTSTQLNDKIESAAVKRLFGEHARKVAAEAVERHGRHNDSWINGFSKEFAKEMAAHGNPASRSDLEVGARALETGIWGAFRNVAINLPGIEDEALRQTATHEAEALAARAVMMRDEVLEILALRQA